MRVLQAADCVKALTASVDYFFYFCDEILIQLANTSYGNTAMVHGVPLVIGTHGKILSLELGRNQPAIAGRRQIAAIILALADLAIQKWFSRTAQA